MMCNTLTCDTFISHTPTRSGPVSGWLHVFKITGDTGVYQMVGEDLGGPAPSMTSGGGQDDKTV